MRDRVWDKVVRGVVRKVVRRVVRALCRDLCCKPPSRKNTSLRVVLSGFRVVSEWFWRVPNLPQSCPEGCPGVCLGVCPGLLGPRRVVWGFVRGLSRAFGPSKLCGGLSGGLSGLSRRFCALKAVRRVVGGLSGGLSGVLSPFGPKI